MITMKNVNVPMVCRHYHRHVDRHQVYILIDMSFDKITYIQGIDQICMKMCVKEVPLAPVIVFLAQCWYRDRKKEDIEFASLLILRKYSATDFLRDLILDENLLNLKF